MDKQQIYDYIDTRAADFTRISDAVWEFAELSLKEYQSAACYVEFLKAEGFEVRENIAEIPTAFSAAFGSGRPIIGILAEYDALTGLSQKPCIAHPEPLMPGGNGHGCGHNLLGAGALAAAVAVKQLIGSGELSGTVVLYGCPGEEGCAAKAFMARDGLFRDLDAALTWHPADTNEVSSGSCMASLQYVYRFEGIASHAAASPHMGRSALDAAELMNVGVQFLREHMASCDSVHYSFLNAGGESPNVVQPVAELVYMVRSDNVRNAKRLLGRVHNIARGAALMTDTAVSWKQIDGTSSMLSNAVLEELLHRNLTEAPLPEYTGTEIGYAKSLFDTYEKEDLPGDAAKRSRTIRNFVREATRGGTTPLNRFVMPWHHSEQTIPGSTDVGDVSWLTPTAEVHTATWPSGAPGHSWQNVAVGKSSVAHKGMLYAGKVLAASVAELMLDPELLEKARMEFHETAGEGYDCPLEPDLRPEAVV